MPRTYSRTLVTAEYPIHTRSRGAWPDPHVARRLPSSRRMALTQHEKCRDFSVPKSSELLG